jgi:hypothetical protein
MLYVLCSIIEVWANWGNILNEFNFELIKDKKILIGTPTYENHIMINHQRSIIDLVSIATNVGMKVTYLLGTHDSLIPRMRNNLAKYCLEKEYDYLFFIDSDVSFQTDDFFHTIYLAETKNMEVIAGPYPKKTIFWENIDKAIKNNLIKNSEDYQKYTSLFSINFKNDEKFNAYEPFEVDQASTGFMLISKNILEEFLEKYPDQIGKDYDGSNFYAFFETKLDPKTKNFLSEDFLFCNMVKDMGHKIWLLPYVVLDHMGTNIFSGKFENYIENLKN